MGKHIYTFILIFIVFSCKKTNIDGQLTNKVKIVKQDNISNSNDTLVVLDENTVVFINPNNEDIEELKKKHGEENFYIIADDVAGYLANITEQLDLKKIKYISTTNENVIYFKEIGLYINKKELKNKWTVLFVDKNKTIKTVAPIDFNFSEIEKFEYNKIETNQSSISEEWYGDYNVTINEDSKDWRDSKDVSITIVKDSIIYEAAGYQMFQKYNLSGSIVNNKLRLVYLNLIDGSESAVLDKTKDFGEISYDDVNYKWVSPYIDISFMDEKKNTYILKKK